MTAAWQTYHDKAREQLAALEPITHDGVRNVSPVLTSESKAQVATAWALLALVEVLKPQDDLVLEVKPPDLEARFEHARALMEMQTEYDRLVPHVGREVRWGEHFGVLGAVSREDVDNAIVWCTFLSKTAAVDNCVVRSTEIEISTR